MSFKSAMNNQRKRQVLENRLALLRGHIEQAGGPRMSMVWTPVSLGGAPARKLSLAAVDCRFTRELARGRKRAARIIRASRSDAAR